MYNCIDDYGNLKPSLRQCIQAAFNTQVTQFKRSEMIMIGDWESDYCYELYCLVVWKDDPDGIVLRAYY